MTTTYTLMIDGVIRHTAATMRADAILLAEDWVQDGDWPDRDTIEVALMHDGDVEYVDIRTGHGA